MNYRKEIEPSSRLLENMLEIQKQDNSNPKIYRQRLLNNSIVRRDYDLPVIYCNLCYKYIHDKNKTASEILKENRNKKDWHNKNCPLYQKE